MTEDITHLTFEPCPHCSGSHIFDLTIRRAHVLLALRWPPPPPRRRSFRVAATCPTKGGAFILTVELEEAPTAPVKTVEASARP